MKIKIFFAAGLMLLAVFAFAACADNVDTPEEEETVEHTLTVTSDSGSEISDFGGQLVINVQSNTDWHVTSSAAWAVPSTTKGRGNGTVNVNIGENPSLNDRSATVTVSDCMDYNWDGTIDEYDLRPGDVGFVKFNITQKGGELVKPNVDIYEKVVFDWLVDGTAVGYDVSPNKLNTVTVPGKYLKATRNPNTGRYSAYFSPTDQNGGDVKHGTTSYNGYYHAKFEDTPVAEMLADGLSAEFYFKPEFTWDGNGEVKPFSCMQAGGFGFMFSKATSKGEGNFCVILNTTVNGKSGWRYVHCGFVPEEGKWYHAVYVYNQAEEKEYLYMNGELAGEADAPGTFNQPKAQAGYFVVGGDPAVNDGATCTSAFKGEIGLARIYSEPMSATQAAALYNEIK